MPASIVGQRGGGRYGSLLAGLRRRETGAECRDARIDANAAAPNRGLERHALERQRARAGERAEQHGAQRAAGCVRDPRHVERDQRMRGVAARREQHRLVGAAMRQRDLLGHRKHAVRRGDRAAVFSGVTKPRSTARAAYHQFGGEHDLDIARHRHEQQHRLAAGRRAASFGNSST